MNNWSDLEGHHNGAIYSRNVDNYIKIPKTLVLCTIPRLYTPHCANELKAADDLYREFKDAGIALVFASTDSPEVQEKYFSEFPVGFPFIRVNRKVDYDLGVTDRYGDAGRMTFIIKDQEPLEVLSHAFDEERDMWAVLQKAISVLS